MKWNSLIDSCISISFYIYSFGNLAQRNLLPYLAADMNALYDASSRWAQ